MNQNYSRKEKLKSRSQIKSLFEKGSNVYQYPFHLYYWSTEMEDSWIKFGVSVRKKDFKKAVDRNLLKRRMRVCFRMHKAELQEALGLETYCVMLVYVGKEIMDLSQMEQAYLELTTRLKVARSQVS